MKRKLTLVGPVYPYRGGISQFTTGLSHNLSRAGHPLQTISFSRQYPAWLYPGKSDRDLSQEHPEIDVHYTLDPVYPWTWRTTASIIADFDPERVLIQWWTSFWAPAFWGISQILRRRGIPITWIIHNVMPHEARFFDRRVAQGLLSRADSCIVLSPKEEQRLQKLLPGMRIFRGHLPVVRISGKEVLKSDARRVLGIGLDEQVILFFGIVRAYNGLHVLLDALGILNQRAFRPLLLIAGEFWEEEQDYRAQAERLGIMDRIRIDNRFIPSEVTGEYFAAADLFAAPYTGGTQSAVARTALSYQLPVIASDQIASDLPLDTYPITVFPAGDSTALADCIQKALTSPPVPRPAQLQESSAPGDEWRELLRLVELACAPSTR